MKKTLIALLLVLALVLSCVAVLAGCGGKDDPGKDDPGKDDPGKDDPGKESGVTEEDLKLDEDIKVREDSIINVITDPEDGRAAGDEELYVR